MASCPKGFGERQSVAIFDRMKKDGHNVEKTGLLHVYTNEKSFCRTRSLGPIAQRIVDGIVGGIKRDPSKRVFTFVETVVDMNSNKHSTVLEAELVSEDNLHLRYFDSNGPLYKFYDSEGKKVPKYFGSGIVKEEYRLDYNVLCLIKALNEKLEEAGYDVKCEQVMEKNINDLPGDGDCDMFALYYTKLSLDNGYEATKEFMNKDVYERVVVNKEGNKVREHMLKTIR
jgi:hypothetical protein